MAESLEATVEEYHRALAAFVLGDCSLQEALYARRDDVTLANPLGPPARGFDAVARALRSAAAQLRDGEIVGFERIAEGSGDDLAYTIEVERSRVKFGGADERMPSSLRVTTIYRRAEDGWRLQHRHADPITAPRPIETVIETER
jgi:ketosteroid isomerase-like protein